MLHVSHACIPLRQIIKELVKQGAAKAICAARTSSKELDAEVANAPEIIQVIKGVDVSTSVDEHSGSLETAFSACPVERRPALAVGDVDACATAAGGWKVWCVWCVLCLAVRQKKCGGGDTERACVVVRV